MDQASQPGGNPYNDGAPSKNSINAPGRIQFDIPQSKGLNNVPSSSGLSRKVDNVYGGLRANVNQSAAPTITADMRVQARTTPFLPFFFWVRAVKIEHDNEDLALEVNRRLVTRVLTKVHRSLCKSSPDLYVYSHECTTDDCLARHPYLNKSALRVRPTEPPPSDQPEDVSESKKSGQETGSPNEEQTNNVPKPGKKVTFRVPESKAKKRIRLYFRSGNYGVDKLAANSLTLTPALVSRYPSTNHFVQDPQILVDYSSMERLLHAFYIESYELIRLFAFPEVFSDHEVIRRYWGSFETITRASNAYCHISKPD